jgi:hypothetical protein
MGKEVILIIMLGAMQGFSELVDWPEASILAVMFMFGCMSSHGWDHSRG